MKEAGLYDYILFNQDVEVAVQQLTDVAQRALAGEVSRRTLTPRFPFKHKRVVSCC
jgi:hypothetical protein